MNKSITLAAAMSALVLSAPVLHAAPGDNIARLKAININPDVDSDVAGLDVDDKTTAEIGITHFFTSNWAVDLGLSLAKHDVTLNGNGAGSAKLMPLNVIAQYHFMPEGATVRPYVGAGLNYTHFSDVDIQGGSVNVEKDRFGPVIQAGLDVPIDNAWSVNADVKKVWLSTDASGAASGSIDIDPWVFGVGVGYKF